MAERTARSPESEKSSRSIVFFDIDNTLIEGFSIMLFADYLNRRGILADQVYSEMQLDMRLPRSTEKEYTQFAIIIVDRFYSGLRGISAAQIESEGKKFLQEYQTKLKPYARKLMEIIKTEGETIAVSGAVKEAFQPLATLLGIEELHLLEGETTNGVYTGRVKVNTALGDSKRKVVQEITSLGFNNQTSYAFGDHLDHDSPILNAVSNSFLVLDENDPYFKYKKRAALTKGYIPVTKDQIIQEVRQRILEVKSQKQT